jgi:hypothetical protein
MGWIQAISLVLSQGMKKVSFGRGSPAVGGEAGVISASA